MRSAGLQDRIYRGLNAAARIVGTDTSVFRPSTSSTPLAPENRFMRLPAVFTSRDGQYQHTNGYGQVMWNGVFDAAYTRPGDYLVQERGTWFIASQQFLAPVLCVKTNRVISITQQTGPFHTGLNAYGGSHILPSMPLLANWPASVLDLVGKTHPEAGLPSDVPVPYWTVLVPGFAEVVVRSGDFISDDLGRNAVVVSAELTELGWRVAARQATT